MKPAGKARKRDDMGEGGIRGPRRARSTRQKWPHVVAAPGGSETESWSGTAGTRWVYE
jgi:hypothetical protein